MGSDEQLTGCKHSGQLTGDQPPKHRGQLTGREHRGQHCHGSTPADDKKYGGKHRYLRYRDFRGDHRYFGCVHYRY